MKQGTDVLRRMARRTIGVISACLLLTSMSSCALAAGVGSAGRAAANAKGASHVWLSLDWVGGCPPPAGEHLSVYRDGTIEVRLESRRNGRLGTFVMTLSPARLAELRRAVKRAALPKMEDTYPKEVSMTEVTISIDDPELGRKRVTAYSGEGYPSNLRPLFDDTAEGRVGPNPGGLLSRLIGDATAHPLAAMTVQIGIPKGALHAGDPFTPELIVKSIGRKPVVVPSFECKEIVSGYASVTLWHDPPPAGQRDTAVDGTYLQSGPRLLGYHETLDDAGAADLEHMVRIEPAKEWRIRMPKALVAPTPGRYRLDAQFWADLLYKRSAVTERLSAQLVSGWIFPESVSITVSK